MVVMPEVEDRRTGSFWGRLDDGERGMFAKAGRMRRYERDATLVRAGEPGSWAAVLCRGSVRVTCGPRVVGARRAGDFVGEQVLLRPQPCSTTVIAATTVHALIIDGRTLDRLLNQHPKVLRVLCAALAELLADTYQKLADAGDEAFNKVVRHLLQHCEGPADAGRRLVSLRIGSQSALADALGISRHSVGRALQRLRAGRVLSIQRGVVIVRDLDALRAAVT
jgi:CRP/FNR family cyclic AMP-dependent transcriptional regulator